IDVICKHALALSIGWSLGKCARTRYVALANVEPVARNFPLWNHHARHCRCYIDWYELCNFNGVGFCKNVLEFIDHQLNTIIDKVMFLLDR
ncbi:MAG TPA: hypothetical protein VFQ47_02840, partial [Nitrososphaera sp.]|nr:hypothetical protein [Nitrososphaera sp.]